MDAKEARYVPVLRWPGGKTRMLKHLLLHVPAHLCYCEPFADGLVLLMAKPRSPVEIVNDLNGDLVALYRCPQYHLPELLRELSCLVSSRHILKDFLHDRGLTDIQRAARFYYRNRISLGGDGWAFGVHKTKGGGIARRQSLPIRVHPRKSVASLRKPVIPPSAALL